MWRKQDRTRHVVSRLLPACIILLTVAFSGSSSMLGIYVPSPMLSWIGVYYWSLFRPVTLPYWFIFLLGLLQDLVCGLPLGTSSCILLLLRLIIARTRHMLTLQHFIAIWMGFAVVATASGVLCFILYNLATRSWEESNIIQIMLSVVFTWMLYPLFHLVFNRLYSLLPALQPRAHSL